VKGVRSVAKPVCNIVGTDGNVYALIGKVSKALEDAGLSDLMAQFVDRSLSAGSYDDVLTVSRYYVELENGDSSERTTD